MCTSHWIFSSVRNPDLTDTGSCVPELSGQETWLFDGGIHIDGNEEGILRLASMGSMDPQTRHPCCTLYTCASV